MLSDKDTLKRLSVDDLVYLNGGQGHIFYALVNKTARYFMVNWKRRKVVSVKNPSLARKKGATDGVVKCRSAEEAMQMAADELSLGTHPFAFISQRDSESSRFAPIFLLKYDIPVIDTFLTGSLPDSMC